MDKAQKETRRAVVMATEGTKRATISGATRVTAWEATRNDCWKVFRDIELVLGVVCGGY